MKDIRKKSLKALKWDMTGKMLNQTVTFVLSIFLARLLSPEDFGIIGIATVIIALAQSFLSFGLGTAIVQNPKNSPLQESTVFYINMILGLILTFSFYFLADSISAYYQNDYTKRVLQVLALLFFINSLNVVQTARLRKTLSFDILVKADVIGALVSGIVGVTMAFAGFGVWSLVAKTLLHSLCRTAVVWYLSTWRPSLLFSLNSIKQLWNYGYKMFLSGVLNTIYQKMDVLIIGKLFSLTQLGFYNRAKSFNELIVRFTSRSLSRVLFPVFSNIQDNREKVRVTVAKSLNALSFLVFGLMGILFLCGSDIILILFGVKWLPSIPYFKLLIFSAYGYPVSAVLVNVLSGLGNSSAFLKLEIIKKIVQTLAIPIGFYFGIEGYLIALIISVFVNVLINMKFVQNEITYSTKKQFIDVYIYIIPCFIAAIFSYYLLQPLKNIHIIHMISASGLYCFFYLGFNFILRTEGLKILYNLCFPSFKKGVTDIINKFKLEKTVIGNWLLK